MTLVAKQRTAGWLFLAPASIMIAVMSFYPMIRAFIISLQTGAGANMRFADPIFSNYKRILADKVFQQSIVNTFLYLIIQVPIMLILAILLAQLLNNKDLKLRGFFRTCVFLPCATSLVSYSLIFRSMFATDGLINSILIKLGILSTGYNFLGNSTSAKIVIILALIWIGSGNLSVFISFLVVFPILYVNTITGLQNTDPKLLEMARVFAIPLSGRIRCIYLPAMIPYLTSGCRVALGMSWKSGIAAEVIGIPSHTIGENLYLSKIYLATSDLFAWTIVIILVSAAFEQLFLKLMQTAIQLIQRKEVRL